MLSNRRYMVEPVTSQLTFALLSLLRTYRRRIAPLVLNHCSHDVESMKSALFLKMHDRLKVLEVMDKNLFNQVIANISDSTTWKNITSLNVHISDSTTYKISSFQYKHCF
jgi:hypothetical protein